MMVVLASMFEWTYSGVDHDLDGNGGESCINFLPPWQRVVETLLCLSVAAAEIYFSYQKITLPDKIPYTDRYNRTGKRLMLLIMSLVFGIELGFKFATRQMIFILNPCHLITIMQVCFENTGLHMHFNFN